MERYFIRYKIEGRESEPETQLSLLEKKRIKPIVFATDENIGKLVMDAIAELGNEADLNFIDTSHVTDMSHLFKDTKFNGDISKWDTSQVTDMSFMFYKSNFRGDISNWDTSNVTNMCYMFTRSKFNGDISKWDTSSVINMPLHTFTAK